MANNLMNLLTALDEIKSPLVFSLNDEYKTTTMIIHLKPSLMLGSHESGFYLLTSSTEDLDAYLFEYNIKLADYQTILMNINSIFELLSEEEINSLRNRSFAKSKNNKWSSFMNNNKNRIQIHEARELFLV